MDLFEKYIPNASKSIFRFEGLQDYSGQDGGKMVATYLKSGDLPNPANSKWWKDMKKKNEGEVKTHRVRLVIRPLNGYTKMELAYLKEASRFSGEDIRIIEEKEFRKVSSDILTDFYLIDDKHLFLMEYTDKGKYIKSELIDDDEKIREYIKYERELLDFSTKLI